MWVRSKDKEELINVQRFSVIDKRVVMVNSESDGDYAILGRYETKERAIEVLNYIQDNILDYEYAKGTHDAPKYIVFEMSEK